MYVRVKQLQIATSSQESLLRLLVHYGVLASAAAVLVVAVVKVRARSSACARCCLGSNVCAFIFINVNVT